MRGTAVRVAAVKSKATSAKAAKPPPPMPAPAPSRRRGITPLTPMRVQAAKSMTKLADSMKESHPDMLAHQHVRDAARMLRSGNEEAAQRHLRAAMFAMTPQSLMRNGLHTDDHHIAARDAMHGIHRHLLLVKDVADVAAKNQANLRRDSYDDDSSSPPPVTSPVRPDPNAGYGPGALAQKPTARQPPGNQALNAPARGSSGGSDPAVADPVGVQPRGSKQLSRTWRDLGSVIDLVGPKGYIHGWIFVGIPAPGDKVSIPGHGPGKVVSGNAKHARVKLASGHVATIAHDGNAAKPGKLAKSASAPPAPKEDEADYVAANRKQANAAIAKGETLFHGTKAEFKPGDIIDAHHAREGVTRLHEGKQYAFASSDPGEATFAGGAGDSRGGHMYRVEPVDKYEFDPHQGSATSRRTTGGFRVVEEVKKWSGSKMDKPFSYKALTPAQKKAYVNKGTVPAGMAPPPPRTQQHARENVMTTDLAAYGWNDLAAVIEMASAGGHHIAGTPDTYSHGWKLRGIGGGKTELHDKLPTADKMSTTALKAHMSYHHSSGINIGGRRVGKKNPSKDDLLAIHEAMHANEPLSVNPPGTADRSALKGGYSRIGQAHTHGNVTGMASRRPGIELSARTAQLEATPAPYGKPGGPGLYGVAGMKHSDYFEQVVKALMARGKDKGTASKIAYGALRKWSAGGGHVHPEVRAAATGALAQEAAKGAVAKAVHGHANRPGRVVDLNWASWDAGHGSTAGQKAHDTASATAKATAARDEAAKVHSLADLSESKFPGTGKPIHDAADAFARNDPQAAGDKLQEAQRAIQQHPRIKAEASQRRPRSPADNDASALNSQIKTHQGTAAQMSGSQLSVTWADVNRAIELAAAAPPPYNPAQPRVPSGQAGGGQFGAGQQQQAAGAKSLGSKTASASAKATMAKKAQAKQGFLQQAAYARAQADKLIAQRKALQAQLASASGKTSSGQSGSTTSAGSSTTASSAPAASTTASSTAAATPASTTAATPAASASSAPAPSAAQLTTAIAGLTKQIAAYQVAYKQAMAQAAAVK